MKKDVNNFLKKTAAFFTAAVTLLCAANSLSMHKCTRCGRRWHGEAYAGSNKKETLCAECAYKYWYPQRYENHKKPLFGEGKINSR